MGGHYTAQAKNFITDMWGHYDDNVVQEINGPSLGRTTYMLFLRIKN
jgi:ubiquitin C-terminal hydrolase